MELTYIATLIPFFLLFIEQMKIILFSILSIPQISNIVAYNFFHIEK